MTNRGIAAFQERAQRIRNRYYAGEIKYASAFVCLRALALEFATKGTADSRLEDASTIVREYLEPAV